MHLGAAERLVVGLLAGGHLHQRRAAEEHLGLLLDHHGVVAHARARRRRRRWSCRRPARSSAAAGADARVRSRKSLPPGMKISFCVGRSAPPDSTREIVGSPFSSAIWEARKIFFTVHGLLAPPLTVGSLAVIRHSTPSTTPMPVTTLAPTVKSRAPAGQRRQLEERRARVDQQLDPLARAAACRGRGAGRRTSPRRRRPPWRARRRGRRASRASPRGCVDGHLLSTTAFIRSSVVRMPSRLVRPRSGPSTSQ